jgi:hypothetical protein
MTIFWAAVSYSVGIFVLILVGAIYANWKLWRKSQDTQFHMPLFPPAWQNSSTLGTTATCHKQKPTLIPDELRAL